MSARTSSGITGTAPRLHAGRFCDIYYDEKIEAELRAAYGRGGLCIKAFRESDTFGGWEGQPLHDVSRIQNIGAAYGVAPRVYDVVDANGLPAQVTDYCPIEGEPTLEAISMLIDVLLSHDIGTTKVISIGGGAKWDLLSKGNVNWGNNLFLDWGGYYLKDPGAYVDSLRCRVSIEISKSKCGRPVDTTYQSVLGTASSRNTEHRVEVMRLAGIDFTGKTVLDLGANLGAFSFYAHDRGALRVTAVDVPLVAAPMREVSNWLGYWNIDWIGTHLSPGRADEVGFSDIVFALSICNHVGGYGSWIADLCNDTLILEGHGGDPPEKYAAALAADFASVDMIGYTSDHMKRPVFVCRR